MAAQVGDAEAILLDAGKSRDERCVIVPDETNRIELVKLRRQRLPTEIPLDEVSRAIWSAPYSNGSSLMAGDFRAGEEKPQARYEYRARILTKTGAQYPGAQTIPFNQDTL